MYETIAINKFKYIKASLLFFVLNIFVVYWINCVDIFGVNGEITILGHFIARVLIIDPIGFSITMSIIFILIGGLMKSKSDVDMILELYYFNKINIVAISLLLMLLVIVEITKIENISMIISIILIIVFQLFFQLLYVNAKKEDL